MLVNSSLVLLSSVIQIFIGTHDKAPSQGVYRSTFDSQAMKLSEVELVAVSKTANAIQVSHNGEYLYVAGKSTESKTPQGFTQSYKISSSGHLELISRLTSHGGSCDLAVSTDGKTLSVANYLGGSVVSYELGEGGALKEKQLKTYQSLKSASKAVRAHDVCYSPDGQYLLVPSISTNEIFIHKITDGVTQMESSYTSPSFNGPRQLTFSKDGKFVYLLNQMGSNLSCLTFEDGELKEFDSLSTLPPKYVGPVNHASQVHLHPSGKFLYAANRGKNNSLSVFSRDPKSGGLRFSANLPSGGVAPWAYAISAKGDFLFMTNNKTNNLKIFSIGEDGMPSDTGLSIKVPNPSSISLREVK